MKQAVYKEEKSWIFWSIITIVIGFLVISPFYRGLFNGYTSSFEGAIYSAIIWAGIALLIVAIYFTRHWRLSSHRDILSVLIWLIPLSYWISSFGAASSHLAMNEVYIKILWAIFFVIGAYFASNSLGSRIIQYALVGSGYILVIYGLMNWFGNAEYKDAVLGNRLSGVFQYPNSYAAYLIALLVSSVVLVNTVKKSYVQIVSASMLVPIVLSLLLTLSRGALVILPFVVVAYLLCIPWYKQIVSIVYFGLAGISSLFIYSRMTEIRFYLAEQNTLNTSLKGWLLLVVTSFVVSSLIYILNRYVVQLFSNKIEQLRVNHWMNIILPIFVILGTAGAYLLLTTSSAVLEIMPDEIRVRIEGITLESSSVFQRNTFYKDAIKISNDYPVFGAGGGAWSALYNSYKSYPYTSTQAHNFFMQYLVEVGLVGIIILFAIIIYAIILFIRCITKKQRTDFDESKLIYPLFSVVILGHSILDFDMSFVYISTLVFLTLGASISMEREPKKWLTNINKRLSPRILRYGLSSALLIISVFVLIQLISAQRADSLFKSAREIAITTHNYNDFQLKLKRSLELSPRHPEYNLFKADIMLQLYRQTQNEQFLDQVRYSIDGIKKKEINRNVLELEYAFHIEKQDHESALHVIESGVERNPWDINLYEKAIQLYVQLGVKEDNNQTTKTTDNYLDKALSLAEQIRNKANYIETLPSSEKIRSEEFNINNRIVSDIARVYFYRGQYEEVTTFLRGYLTRNLDKPENRAIMRYFLASSLIQGMDSKEMRELLFGKDPNEEQYVSELINTAQ